MKNDNTDLTDEVGELIVRARLGARRRTRARTAVWLVVVLAIIAVLFIRTNYAN